MSKENWPLIFGSRKVIVAPFNGLGHWVELLAEQFDVSDEEFSLKKSLADLQYGHKDLILHDANIFKYQISNLRFPYEVVETGDVIGDPSELSIYALTNENLTRGDSLAAVFSRAVIDLRRKGLLKRILRKYGVRDWNTVNSARK